MAKYKLACLNITKFHEHKHFMRSLSQVESWNLRGDLSRDAIHLSISELGL